MTIDFLYTDIGRGHPFYLDGIQAALPGQALGHSDTVFTRSRGLSLLGWRLARAAYLWGSSRAGGGLYTRARFAQQRAQGGWLAERLCRDLRRHYGASAHPLVVAHPLLVNALRDVRHLYYQHGELVAPAESLLPGSHTVFVPDVRVAEAFIKAGLSKAQIIVTGLNIENDLCDRATELYTQRCERLRADPPLTGAFFSSGAEPAPHLHPLMRCIASHLDSGGKAFVFCRDKGRFHRRLNAQRSRTGSADDRLRIEPFTTRQELHEKTMLHFGNVDFFVSPSHERSHWAMGLGLPMFVVNPAIGTFAPLNRTRLLEAGVGRDLPAHGDAEFSTWLHALRDSGALAEMAARGWGRYPIQGFRAIAEHLLASH